MLRVRCVKRRGLRGRKNKKPGRGRAFDARRLNQWRYFASLVIECVKREILRLAEFLWITFRCAARISSGSACFIAASAALRSPFAIASSTLRTVLRILVRRALLIAVRRAILRVALRADVVLAILSSALSCLWTVPRRCSRTYQARLACREPLPTETVIGSITILSNSVLRHRSIGH